MAKKKKSFDFKLFAVAINKKRFEIEHKKMQRFGFRELAKEVGISYATLSRIANGKSASIDSVICICEWMKKNINTFIK